MKPKIKIKEGDILTHRKSWCKIRITEITNDEVTYHFLTLNFSRNMKQVDFISSIATGELTQQGKQ